MKNSTKRPRLKILPPPPPRIGDEDEYMPHTPEGLPPGAVLCAYHIVERDYPALGIHENDWVVTWVDAPVASYDIAVVQTTEEVHEDGHCLGRYYTGPGGYVRVDDGDGYCTFKPSDVLHVYRAMHVERRGEIVRKFRPAEGGAK